MTQYTTTTAAVGWANGIAVTAGTLSNLRLRARRAADGPWEQYLVDRYE